MSETRGAPVAWQLLAVVGWVYGGWGYFPLLPWLGIGWLGAALGRAFVASEERAARLALAAGGGALLAFVGIKLGGGLGNLRPPESVWRYF